MRDKNAIYNKERYYKAQNVRKGTRRNNVVKARELFVCIIYFFHNQNGES